MKNTFPRIYFPNTHSIIWPNIQWSSKALEGKLNCTWLISFLSGLFCLLSKTNVFKRHFENTNTLRHVHSHTNALKKHINLQDKCKSFILRLLVLLGCGFTERMREFSCPPACIWVGGWTSIVAPGRMLVCKCSSVQEWGLTKCKWVTLQLQICLFFESRLRSYCPHSLCTLTFFFCVCVCVLYNKYLLATYHVAFCQLILSSGDLGQLQSAVVILVSTAAQRHLTLLNVSSNFKTLLGKDALIVLNSQLNRDQTWGIEHLSLFKTKQCHNLVICRCSTN